MNVRVLRKGLKLLNANGDRFEINQLLFADNTAPVAVSEDKLCKLVSEFGRVCERRKLRVNVSKNKVMRCSRSIVEETLTSGKYVSLFLISILYIKLKKLCDDPHIF